MIRYFLQEIFNYRPAREGIFGLGSWTFGLGFFWVPLGTVIHFTWPRWRSLWGERVMVEVIKDEILMMKLSYILSGSNRIKICYFLFSGLKTARDLEKETNVPLSSICRSLKELKENEIILCVNETFHGSKLYSSHPDIDLLKDYIIERMNSYD
jgi:hypothetical protein